MRALYSICIVHTKCRQNNMPDDKKIIIIGCWIEQASVNRWRMIFTSAHWKTHGKKYHNSSLALCTILYQCQLPGNLNVAMDVASIERWFIEMPIVISKLHDQKLQTHFQLHRTCVQYSYKSSGGFFLVFLVRPRLKWFIICLAFFVSRRKYTEAYHISLATAYFHSKLMLCWCGGVKKSWWTFYA